MNKKEVIEKIKNLNARETFMSEIIWVKRDDVLDIINQLDEPEKPVLSKEEAEWLEHLKLIGNFTHCLYVITRQGWGCDFEFRSHGKKYKLSCASAGGEFKDVKLDAVITDVEFGEPEVDEGDEDFGEYSMRNTVTLYHNQNPIAIADCEADAGNGGYYYSVCSLVIKNVHYKVVEA